MLRAIRYRYKLDRMIRVLRHHDMITPDCEAEVRERLYSGPGANALLLLSKSGAVDPVHSAAYAWAKHVVNVEASDQYKALPERDQMQREYELSMVGIHLCALLDGWGFWIPKRFGFDDESKYRGQFISMKFEVMG